MGKRYKVTEDNYKDILKRILKFSDKFYMLRHYMYVDVSNPSNMKITYERKSWDNNKEATSRFIYVTEHIFKTQHDAEGSDYMYDGYKYKPLIHLKETRERSFVITTGCEVEFTSYGFIVYEKKSEVKPNDVWFVYRYIADRTSPKISNHLVQEVREAWRRRNSHIDYTYPCYIY